MITGLIVFLVLLLLIKYIWNRRWFYYYSSKIPGPSGIPLLVPFSLIRANSTNWFEKLIDICKSQPPVFKLYLANQLLIFDSEPEHLDTLLNTFLNKPAVYQVLDGVMKNGLLTAPVDIWQSNRKIIRHTFHSQTLASFHEIFVEYSERIVGSFAKDCGEETTDSQILAKVWECTLFTAFKTLMDINPTGIKDHSTPSKVTVRTEEIFIERLFKFWMMIPFVWRFSRLRQEMLSLKRESDRFMEEEIIDEAKKTHSRQNISSKETEDKRFLPYLLNQSDGKITDEQIKQESKLILARASETTAVTLLHAILTLGLYPEIQDAIYQEISSHWGANDEDLTPETVNQLNYLERVIKETMRLFPAVPIIARSIDKNIKLGKYTFPAGSELVTVISHLHRRPDLWPDPLKFDPDRFLPENITKRHRCAYIPFSYGQRNCIGFQYGLMSTRIMLAHIVKNFSVRATNYRSLEDIELKFHLILMPKNCRVTFEKRGTVNN